MGLGAQRHFSGVPDGAGHYGNDDLVGMGFCALSDRTVGRRSRDQYSHNQLVVVGCSYFSGAAERVYAVAGRRIFFADAHSVATYRHYPGEKLPGGAG